MRTSSDYGQKLTPAPQAEEHVQPTNLFRLNQNIPPA